jgi:hypothetical protein
MVEIGGKRWCRAENPAPRGWKRVEGVCGGLRAVWESQADFDRFFAERMMPIIREIA